MKLRLVLITLSLIVSFWEVQGQVSNENPRVIFYRNTGAVKSATQCKVYVGDELLASIKNKSAWTQTFSPGEYTFQSLMTLDKEKGKTLTLNLEKGNLYLIEIKIGRKGGNQILPSSGYYFILKEVSQKLIQSQIKRKVIADALKDALFEELKSNYQLK